MAVKNHYIKHWMHWTRFYKIWWWIVWRCKQKWHSSFKNYWWRWIKCERWCFEDFKNDMYESYLKHCELYWEKNTSIDRINNDWNYCKENCRWATNKEQDYNKRINIYTTIDWKKYFSCDISSITWLCRQESWRRINKYNNWDITKEELFKKSSYHRNIAIVDGVKYTSNDIASIAWITQDWWAHRIKRFNEWVFTKEQLFSTSYIAH